MVKPRKVYLRAVWLSRRLPVRVAGESPIFERMFLGYFLRIGRRGPYPFLQPGNNGDAPGWAKLVSAMAIKYVPFRRS